MMETEEKLPLPEIEQHDAKKYKKHINEVIEDAEIEAEMEAEKKIRSKNSRVFSISIFGLGLLALVYLQINSQTVIPGEDNTASLNTPIESAEEKLAKQVPIVEDGSTHIPLPKITTPKNKVEPAKITLTEKPVPSGNRKTSTQSRKKVKKTIEVSNSTSKSSTIKPAKTNTRFFVQTGAFSKKKNADESMKKLQAKGFSPLIHVVTRGNSKTYLVQLGVFPNKEKAKLAQEKLARAGYPKSIIK